MPFALRVLARQSFRRVAGGGHLAATDRLLSDIKRARSLLPLEHRNLLTQRGAQESAVEDWPEAVRDLYRTVNETPPSPSALDGAMAVWLDRPRMVVFNAPLMHLVTAGLDEASRRRKVAQIAWHKYGHALSVKRSTRSQRADGPRLCDLLPDGIRAAIDYPGGYGRMQVFDEVIAIVYAFVVGCVCDGRYGATEVLHPDILDAFKEVIPWPPSH